jgi:glutamate--cysteine ligase
MELISPVSTEVEGTIDFLANLHRFVYSQIGDEELWAASMPCILAGDDNIPVAQYGSSNVAKMKTTYRFGLGNRYGRLMQTIAGIHYNFSLPDALWAALQVQDMNNGSRQDYITDNYFKLIRNFRRFSWLLIYLFGASPAVCNSFLNGRQHELLPFDEYSLHLPHATALRMGDLGYQSSAQEGLEICYNNLDNYVETLRGAITEPHPAYQNIPTVIDGQYQQLSTALLQIENEFYSPVRPKRVIKPGETALSAIKHRGVEYIEVRCLDVNPYHRVGIDAEQIRFLDCFLLYCLLERSPDCDDADRERINNNLKKVVNRGREPNLQLEDRQQSLTLNSWGDKLLGGVEKIAALLDQAHGGSHYGDACRAQKAKLDNPELTPSARILADMAAQSKPFFRFAMDQTQAHGREFRSQPLSGEQLNHYQQECKLSLEQQRAIEAADTLSFEQYLANYFEQYQQL